MNATLLSYCYSDSNGSVTKSDNSNDSTKYCYQSQSYSMDSIEHYYNIKNIDVKKSDFPEIVKGNDNILVKIDKYSVSLVITDDNGNI